MPLGVDRSIDNPVHETSIRIAFAEDAIRRAVVQRDVPFVAIPRGGRVGRVGRVRRVGQIPAYRHQPHSPYPPYSPDPPYLPHPPTTHPMSATARHTFPRGRRSARADRSSRAPASRRPPARARGRESGSDGARPLDASILHPHEPQRHRGTEAFHWRLRYRNILCVSVSLWLVAVKNVPVTEERRASSRTRRAATSPRSSASRSALRP